jgi:hypothetical protein
MKPKSFLLPHYFQKIGWGLFLFSFVFLFVTMYMFNTLKLFNQNDSPYATLMLYVILLISALFIAFSKEKIEDELIQMIRYSSVVITAYLGFLSYIIILLIVEINQSIGITSRTLANQLLLVNPMTLFIVYVIIFRLRMLILKRRIKNEE